MEGREIETSRSVRPVMGLPKIPARPLDSVPLNLVLK